jgi:hypothetical protein
MAVYDGVPSIRLEGDQKRALALVPEGKVLLQQAQAVCARADVPTYSMNRRVSDDESIYVLIAGGQNIIQISAGVVVPDEVYQEVIESDSEMFPDVLSGLVFGGVIKERQRVLPDGRTETYNVTENFAPTPTTARISKLSLGRQPSARLVVRPSNALPDLQATPPDPRDLSQYAKLRSSMYSGLMRKVAQVAMGLGRIGKAKLADPTKKTPVTQYMKDVDANGVQIQWDYKFTRTHGITRGDDGRLWIVEISNTKGVVAMPLPIFPTSDKPRFRIRAQQRGDGAMETILDELDCVPTGESFPTVKKTYDAKVASGDILVLMTPDKLDDFYRMSGYSSVCGWAFSPDGKEAHNVGMWYPEDDVFAKGAHYQINIKLGAINTDRKKGDPIASGSANLKLQKEGYLYSPPVKFSFMPFKYYEPLLPGLLSASAKPLGPSEFMVKVDTPIFVAFIDGDLKVGSYFIGKSEPYQEVEDDRQPGECLLEGNWTTTVKTGNRSLPSMTYTNDIDERQVLQEHVSITTLTSNSLGFDPPQFSDFIESPETCYVWRNKVYEQHTVTEEKGGEYRASMFVVPGYSREAYYFFSGHGFNQGHRGTDSTVYAYIQDPNVYYGWRKFPRINPPPWPGGWGCDTSNCGGKHTERRVMCWVFEGNGYQGPWAIGGSSDCRSYADSGQWASQCDNVVALCSTPPVRTPRSTGWDKGGDFEGTLTLYMSGLNGPKKFPLTQNQFEYAMVPSPDPETELIQFIFAQSSGIGDDSSIYQTGMSGNYTTKVDGYVPTAVQPADGFPAYIGVMQP